ncbi:MAG: hypothetical protein AAGE98_21425 [Actinomycetota bacterium]
MSSGPVGLILAALDVDVDNGAAWNRWYDLEHLAPNLALPGIVAGHRYVAPPALHTSRVVDGDDAVWGGGRSVYLTWYATSVDPAEAIASMSQRRDELEAEGRMDGAGARIVRSGDALKLVDRASDPALRLAPEDLVHVGHVGLRLVIDRDERPASLGPGVAVSLRFSSAFVPGSFAELQLLTVPAAEVLDELRSGRETEAVLDAGFDRIEPLRHPFVAAIAASDLPRTVEASP